MSQLSDGKPWTVFQIEAEEDQFGVQRTAS